jgi:hypothetical protein
MRMIDIDRKEVEKFLTPTEIAEGCVTRLYITKTKHNTEGVKGMRNYAGIPVDDRDGLGEITVKPLVGATVSYDGQNVKVIKNARKWQIVEFKDGSKRYVKLNNIGKMLDEAALPTLDETIITEENTAPVEDVMSEEEVETVEA